MITRYEDLSVSRFYEVKDIIDTDLELLDKEVALIALLDDKTQDDVLSMGLGEFHEKVSGLRFLTTLPRQVVPDTKYVIDGLEFSVMLNPDEMTVAQYVDYNAYRQMDDECERMIGMLSVFMIPKGKKYGDYNINEVKEKVGKMNVADAMGMSAFFLEWSKALTKVIHTSLIKKLKKMMRKEKDKEVREKIMEAVTHLEDSGDLLQ